MFAHGNVHSSEEIMIKTTTVTLNPALDKTMFFERDFLLGGVNRSHSALKAVGGKGINVSRVMKQYGVNALCTGFIGGINGNIVCELLDTLDIPYRFSRTKAETRINIKIKDAGSVMTEANEMGGPIRESELASFFKELEKDDSDLMVLSGSIPRGLPADTYARIVRKMKEKGKTVVVDCDGEALRLAVEEKPFLIKPNIHELGMYLGRLPADREETIAAIRRIWEEKGVRVLCTMGALGALYIGPEGLYAVPAASIDRIGNTVCAGDTFLAAFLLSYYGHFDPEESGDIARALEIASAAAAAKAEKEGTEIPTAEEMGRHLKGLHAEKLNW
ncbi:MAG: 1-phosphofructokinase family hexose kinase [Ruminococcaceae bacterium]|nr:1-phosphofructokinase family hexose kinase [Oscillospiraceae bacterium]